MVGFVVRRFVGFRKLAAWMLVGLCCCFVLALGSCQVQNFRTAAAQVPQLVVAAPSDPSTFNYALNDSLYSVFGYLFDGLLESNGITGELEPGLAETWQVAPDKKRVTFTLRPGLKWSDGQPLTVEDVLFTFQDIYLNPKIPSGQQDILRIGVSGKFPAVRKLDDRRVEFQTPEPFAPFIRVCGGLPILPKHILEPSIRKTDAKGNLVFLSTWGTDTDPKQIIGNGPYVMTEYTPSQRVVFRRNPYFWQKDPQGQAKPYIERIIYQIIESDANQLIRFRSTELDSIDVKPEMFSLLKQEEKRLGFTVYNGGPGPGTRSLSFNLNQAKDDKGQPLVDPIKSRWFNNQKFRQAVAYAIDRDRIVNNVYRGLAEPLNSPIWSATPYFLKPEEGLKVYNYEPTKSKQILQEAGFKYDSQGQLLDNQGNRVEFTLLVKSEEKSRVDMTTQIAQDLAAIGIKANMQVVSFNTVLQRLTQRSWEAYVGGFGGGGLDPNSGSNIWRSTGTLHQFNQGPQADKSPIQGWVVSDWEKEIDRLFIAGAQELDERKRKAIYGEFQQVVQEQLPFIHLVSDLTLEAVRDRVQNLRFSGLGGSFWNLPDLKVID